jgi:hypothetical protein
MLARVTCRLTLSKRVHAICRCCVAHGAVAADMFSIVPRKTIVLIPVYAARFACKTRSHTRLLEEHEDQQSTIATARAAGTHAGVSPVMVSAITSMIPRMPLCWRSPPSDFTSHGDRLIACVAHRLVALETDRAPRQNAPGTQQTSSCQS